uniref:Low density lipoprotein receptor-related protein associated protein 1 n=1 Tax=Oncorhynchus kisutch TaxID=8019 RepID=A0A8C7ITW4_ONCKI
MKFGCLFAVLCLAVGAIAGKYSREINDQKPSVDGKSTVEFRIAKLNQVWEKATRMQLPPVRQAELHSDLKIQEKDELQWKKSKAEGMDENGEREAKLRRGFNGERGMEGVGGERGQATTPRPNPLHPLPPSLSLPPSPPPSPISLHPPLHLSPSPPHLSPSPPSLIPSPISLHPLPHLSPSPPPSLSIPSPISLPPSPPSLSIPSPPSLHPLPLSISFPSIEIHKNVISPLEGEVKQHVLHQKHTDLKDKMRDLNQGFERLRKLSHEGFSEDSEFKEPRVIELWEMAQRANLTGDELDSLKEELKHFETKVEKHSHYQEQLELSHQKLRHVESLGDNDHILRNQERYNNLAEKTREMGYKMKKHMQDLTSKISRKGLDRNEL